MNNQSYQNQTPLYREKAIDQLYNMCPKNITDNDHYFRDINTGVNNQCDFGLLEEQTFAYGEAAHGNSDLLAHFESKELSAAEVLVKLLKELDGKRAMYSPQSQLYTNTFSVHGGKSSSASPYISGDDSDASSFSGLMPLERSHVPVLDRYSKRQHLQVPQEFLPIQHQCYYQDPPSNIDYFNNGNMMINHATTLYTSPYSNPGSSIYNSPYNNPDFSSYTSPCNTPSIHGFFGHPYGGFFGAIPSSFKSESNTAGPKNSGTPFVDVDSNTHPPEDDTKKISVKGRKPVNLKCATCGKTFSRPYNLKSHQKTHTKERPYACTYSNCSWKFARPHDLRRHILCLHQDIKPYVCTCGKRFARSDAFRRHQTVNIACNPNRVD